MKKTLLVTLDFPPNRGGVAVYYSQLAAGLESNNFFVLAPTQTGDSDFDKTVPYTVIREPLLRAFPQTWPQGLGSVFKLIRTIRWVLLIKAVRRVCRAHDIEIIIAGQVLPIGTVAWLHKLLTKTPYIICAHGMDITVPQYYLRKKRLLKRVLQNAHHLIANSNFTSRELQSLDISSEKITVITPCPNEYPRDAEAIKQVKENEQFTDKKIILTAGRLVERKGHDLVIAALPQVLVEHPDAHYVIVGDGPQMEVLKIAAKKYGVEESITFAGAVTNEMLAAYYERSDVFVMPSRRLANGDVEGFGIVYLEANSFGKPVIGGNSGGVPEAVIDGQTGLLVDPLLPDEIAAAINSLISDPARATQLGQAGKERVERDFQWSTRSAILKNTLKLYD